MRSNGDRLIHGHMIELVSMELMHKVWHFHTHFGFVNYFYCVSS